MHDQIVRQRKKVKKTPKPQADTPKHPTPVVYKQKDSHLDKFQSLFSRQVESEDSEGEVQNIKVANKIRSKQKNNY